MNIVTSECRMTCVQLGHSFRGEKAFCSSDCRFREMMLEEDMVPETSDSDDAYGTPS